MFPQTPIPQVPQRCVDPPGTGLQHLLFSLFLPCGLTLLSPLFDPFFRRLSVFSGLGPEPTRGFTFFSLFSYCSPHRRFLLFPLFSLSFRLVPSSDERMQRVACAGAFVGLGRPGMLVGGGYASAGRQAGESRGWGRGFLLWGVRGVSS